VAEPDESGFAERLRERVKELGALYLVTRVLADRSASLGERLVRVARAIPPAMQFPEASHAAIVLGRCRCESAGFVETPVRTARSFVLTDGSKGCLEVGICPEAAPEGGASFLPEEEHLLTSIAEMLRLEADRDLADRSLAEAERRFQLAAAASSTGIWEWDVAGGAVRWDATLTRLVGMHPYAGAFGSLRDLVHPEDESRVFSRLSRAAEGLDDLAGVELRIQRSDGAWRQFTSKASIARDVEGRVARVVAALVDVTRLRDAEFELGRARRLDQLGQAALGVAHDLNNVLAGLTLGIGVLEEDRTLSPEAHEVLGELRLIAEKGAGVSSHLLALARASGERAAVAEPAQRAASMAPLLRRLMGAGHALELALEPTGLVWADPAEVDQAILNLVLNARDASPPGERVHLHTRRVDAKAAEAWGARSEVHALIEVQDRGCGVPEALHGRIFEPYFSTKSDAGGTGLGLAVVAATARRAGGHVAFETSPEGSVFRVLLPVAHSPQPE
jgi:PAS domain S-box-containing protein